MMRGAATALAVMRALRAGAAGAAGALILGSAYAAPAGAPTAGLETPAQVIERLNLHEAPAPVRERKDWRPPRKVVLLAYDRRTAGERDRLASAVPGARFVLAHDRASAITEAADADVLIGFNPQICDPAILNHARELRWILSLAAGVEQCVAVPSVQMRHLLITNMRGVDSAAIAEHAIALALALAHGLDVFAQDTAERRWASANAARTRMEVLYGKTLLVVGLGGIGTEVARRAHGLGMRVIATRERGHEGPDFVSYVGEAKELEKLAAEADVIVNTAPLTTETRGMFDARFFAVVKPTAYFINVARGASVVTSALTRALDEHRLGGAGGHLGEPPPPPPADTPGRSMSTGGAARGSTSSSPSRSRRMTRSGKRHESS